MNNFFFIVMEFFFKAKAPILGFLCCDNFDPSRASPEPFEGSRGSLAPLKALSQVARVQTRLYFVFWRWKLKKSSSRGENIIRGRLCFDDKIGSDAMQETRRRMQTQYALRFERTSEPRAHLEREGTD